jgi:putative MATE family efflux protein
VAQAFAHLVQMARMGLDVAMQSMVARAMGARQIDLASRIALQSFGLTILVSLVVVVVGLSTTSTLLSIVAVSDEVIELTIVYLQLQFVGSAVQGFRQSTGAALQASGDPFTPMKATLLARGVHLALSPVLIFGWSIFPEMGIPGAAMANVAAQAVGAVWNVYALFAGTSRLKLSLRGFSPDYRIIWRQVKIAIPASGTQLERGLSELVLVRVVAPFGDIALSSYALTRRLERLTHIGSMGLGRASGILVSTNLGASLPERAKSTVRWAMVYVIAIRGAAGLVLFLLPAFFIGIFNDDAAFLETAVIWVQIQAIGGMFLGGGQVMQQSFNVAGDTMAPLVVTFMSMWVLEIPLALVLTQLTPLGQYGIPVAIGVAMLGRLVLYLLYFRTGRWLRAKVLDDDI